MELMDTRAPIRLAWSVMVICHLGFKGMVRGLPAQPYFLSTCGSLIMLVGQT